MKSGNQQNYQPAGVHKALHPRPYHFADYRTVVDLYKIIVGFYEDNLTNSRGRVTLVSLNRHVGLKQTDDTLKYFLERRGLTLAGLIDTAELFVTKRNALLSKESALQKEKESLVNSGDKKHVILKQKLEQVKHDIATLAAEESRYIAKLQLCPAKQIGKARAHAQPAIRSQPMTTTAQPPTHAQSAMTTTASTVVHSDVAVLVLHGLRATSASDEAPKPFTLRLTCSAKPTREMASVSTTATTTATLFPQRPLSSSSTHKRPLSDEDQQLPPKKRFRKHGE